MLSPDQGQQERAERQKTLVNGRLAKRLVSEMTGHWERRQIPKLWLG